MCGISGFLGNFDPGVLVRMTDAIRHRGPDGHGLYDDSAAGIGLGHRRLAIIDLSDRGLQPMWDVQRRVVVVFNGEIYNYKALRADLISAGYVFASECDTEVICNLYLHRGRDFVRALDGMFAFALWDAERRELIVARDEMGIKPLYYSETCQGFVFSSEMKALLRVPAVSRTLDYRSMSEYINLLYCPAPRTPLLNVRKVLPGEVLIVAGRSIVRRFNYAAAPAYENIIGDPIVAGSGLIDHLREAVHNQMVSDVPVGAFLSGGLDSSAIALFAKEYAGFGGLACFTIATEDGDMREEGFANDLPYARRVAKHLGVELIEVPVNASMTRGISDLVYHLDEPQPDLAALNVLYIAKAAKERGVKVLLSGAGGDDVFGGYRRHHALMMERAWSWMPGGMRSGIRNVISRLGADSAWRRRALKATNAMGEADSRRMAGYFSWLEGKATLGLFSESARQQLTEFDPLAPLLAAILEVPANAGKLERMLHLERRYFLPDHNLNYTDKMSMAAGIEVRVPFLDRKLVDFSRRIPQQFKVRRGEGKWIFKRAMEPFLPRDIIYRPKTGFGAPLRAWMRKDMLPDVLDLLSVEAIVRRGIFDARSVQTLRERDKKGQIDASYPLFAVACIEMWCKLFLDSSE